jgi:GT2 family glycosyltransferase
MTDVVMLIYNAQAVAVQAIMHLLTFTPESLRFLFVDNASEDARTLAKFRAWLGDEHVYIRNETNVGVSAGFNQALEESKSQRVIFCNSDHLVLHGWYWPIVQALDHHDVAWAAPEWLPEGPYRISEIWDHIEVDPKFALDFDRHGSSCAVARWPFLRERIGGFDPRFFLVFGDVDHMERMRDAGLKWALVRGALSRHLGKQSRRVLGAAADTEMELADAERFRQKWRDRPDVRTGRTSSSGTARRRGRPRPLR